MYGPSSSLPPLADDAEAALRAFAFADALDPPERFQARDFGGHGRMWCCASKVWPCLDDLVQRCAVLALESLIIRAVNEPGDVCL